jgi:hypothetical protein
MGSVGLGMLCLNDSAEYERRSSIGAVGRLLSARL